MVYRGIAVVSTELLWSGRIATKYPEAIKTPVGTGLALIPLLIWPRWRQHRLPCGYYFWSTFHEVRPCVVLAYLSPRIIHTPEMESGQIHIPR